MPVPRNLKKRALAIIAAAENRSRKNNWEIYWEGEQTKQMPENSLVIQLTRYPEPSQEDTKETL